MAAADGGGRSALLALPDELLLMIVERVPPHLRNGIHRASRRTRKLARNVGVGSTLTLRVRRNVAGGLHTHTQFLAARKRTLESLRAWLVGLKTKPTAVVIGEQYHVGYHIGEDTLWYLTEEVACEVDRALPDLRRLRYHLDSFEPVARREMFGYKDRTGCLTRRFKRLRELEVINAETPVISSGWSKLERLTVELAIPPQEVVLHMARWYDHVSAHPSLAHVRIREMFFLCIEEAVRFVNRLVRNPRMRTVHLHIANDDSVLCQRDADWMMADANPEVTVELDGNFAVEDGATLPPRLTVLQ